MIVFFLYRSFIENDKIISNLVTRDNAIQSYYCFDDLAINIIWDRRKP